MKILQAQEGQIDHLKSVVLESNPHAKPLPSIVERTSLGEKSSPRRSVDNSTELSSASSFVKKAKAPAITSGLPSGVLELRLLLARRLLKVLHAQQSQQPEPTASPDGELGICLRQLVVSPPGDSRSPVKVEERQSQFFRSVRMKVNQEADEVFISFCQAFLIQPPAEYHIFVIEFVSQSMNTVAWACVPTEKMGERVVQLREPPLEPFRVLSEPELRVISGTSAIFDICRPFKPKKSLDELAAMEPGQMHLTQEDEILWRAQPPPKRSDPSFASRWANQRVADSSQAYAPLAPQRRPSASQRQAVDRWLTRWGEDAEALLAPKPPPTDSGSNSGRRLSSIVPSMVQRGQESLAARMAKEEEARRDLDRQIKEEAEKRAAMTARFAELRRRRSSAAGSGDDPNRSSDFSSTEMNNNRSDPDAGKRRASLVPSMVERQAAADKIRKEQEDRERRLEHAREEARREHALRRGSFVPAMVERYENKQEALREQEEREKEAERQRKIDDARRARDQAAARRASHSLPADDATLIVPTMVLQREAKEAAEKRRAKHEAEQEAARKKEEARQRAERKQREEEEKQRREATDRERRAQEQAERERLLKEEQQRVLEAEERKAERLRRDEERRAREQEAAKRLEEQREIEAQEASAKRAERQLQDTLRRQREQEEFEEEQRKAPALKERRRSSVSGKGTAEDASPPAVSGAADAQVLSPSRRDSTSRVVLLTTSDAPPEQRSPNLAEGSRSISVSPSGYRASSFAHGGTPPSPSSSSSTAGGKMVSSRRSSNIVKFIGIGDLEMVESQMLESMDGGDSMEDSEFREEYPVPRRASIVPGTKPARGFNKSQEEAVVKAPTVDLQIDGLLGLPLDATVARILLYFAGLVDPASGEAVGETITSPKLLGGQPAIVLYQDLSTWGGEPAFTSPVDLAAYVGRTSLAVAVVEVASEDDGCYTYGFCVLPIFDHFKPGAYKTRLLPGDPRQDAPNFANRRVPMLTKRPMAAEEYCPNGFIKWRKNCALDSVQAYQEEAGQPVLSDEEKLILKDRLTHQQRRPPASIGIESREDAEKQFTVHMHPDVAAVRALTLSRYNESRTVVLNVESVVQARGASAAGFDRDTSIKYVACRVDVHLANSSESYSFDVLDQDYNVSHGIPIFLDKPLEFSCGPADVRTTAVLRIFTVSLNVASSSASVNIEPFGWSAIDLFTLDGFINQGRFAIPLFSGSPDENLHVRPLLAEPCREAFSKMQKAGDVELVPRTTFITFSISDAARVKDSLLRNAFFSHTKSMYHKDAQGRDHMLEVQDRMRELARRQSSSGLTIAMELRDVVSTTDLRGMIEKMMDGIV